VLRRQVRLPPEQLYPPDDWRIVETQPPGRYYDRAETAFSLSNGHLGLRGTFDEARAPALSPGLFLNGFHETWPILHAENAYGLARTGQTIVNVPDAAVIRLYVDDEPLLISTARLRRYERVLDMRAGTLSRELVWATPGGKDVAVRSCRLVSLEHRHLIAILYEIEPLDRAVPVSICSLVINRQDGHLHQEPGRRGHDDPRRAPSLRHRVLNSHIAEADGTQMLFGYQTTNSAMTLGIGIDHVIETPATMNLHSAADGDVGELVLTAEPEAGMPIRIVKYATYQASGEAPVAELVDRCSRSLDHARRDGFDALLASQRAELDHFWSRSDVRVDGGPGQARLQQAVRWNLFQVGQATWRAEVKGVPAKGLTGQAYEGHYFWDIEIYLLPVLSYTHPRLARNLLRFRHTLLPYARERACELHQRGALFAWRTISGDEASAPYQAGTAQYHINAAIAHSVWRYVTSHQDLDLLAEFGAELLIETARLWEDLGFYADDGRFHLHSVTGPDEYTTVVNDNTYTNLMARLNLNAAAAAVRWLERERPAAHAALLSELDLGAGEPDAWTAAATAMYVPYDERRGVHPQDSEFLERERWDLERTPPDRFPLLMHYHPLVINRHQVIKQADIVLAMFLLDNEFSLEQKRANFDYYDPLTTGDSSLSACIQSIVGAELGDERRAVDYFRFALLMDLGDVAGNVSDGVHIAAAAGVWQALVFGFGGVRDFDGRLSIEPRLPKGWRSLAFSLRLRGRQLRVELAHDEERFMLDEGEPLELWIRGKQYRVSRDAELLLTQGGERVSELAT
jgi:alpha,alpha-trehalose phosphorylase